MIIVWLTSRLDLVLVVLKRMNVGDVVLPGLVKLDRSNANEARSLPTSQRREPGEQPHGAGVSTSWSITTFPGN